jgi:hypothetical protein
MERLWVVVVHQDERTTGNEFPRKPEYFLMAQPRRKRANIDEARGIVRIGHANLSFVHGIHFAASPAIKAICHRPVPTFSGNRSRSIIARLFAEISYEFVEDSVPAVGVRRTLALFQNIWPLFGEFPIQLEPATFRHRIRIREYRFRRTFRNADATVDTFIRMNDEHVFTHIEAVDGANLDTVLIFALDAIIGHDMGHSGSFATSLAATLGKATGTE